MRSAPTSAAAFLPHDATDLAELRRASAGCRGCSLYAHATQTVWGAGNPRARLMLVGEQPGDREDRAGEPFVGPAGRLLHEAMEEAEIPADSVYVTNAVKHFKFEQRGKLRLHKKPSAGEVAACRPWLEAELLAVCPRVVVALGATAGQALLGPQMRVSRDRGRPLLGPGGVAVFPTVHPSAILRVTDRQDRSAQQARFVDDLRAAAGLAAS